MKSPLVASSFLLTSPTSDECSKNISSFADCGEKQGEKARVDCGENVESQGNRSRVGHHSRYSDAEIDCYLEPMRKL